MGQLSSATVSRFQTTLTRRLNRDLSMQNVNPSVNQWCPSLSPPFGFVVNGSFGRQEAVATALADARNLRRQRNLDRVEISEDHVTVTDELLGKGGSGAVYLADFNGRNAAAKVRSRLSAGMGGWPSLPPHPLRVRLVQATLAAQPPEPRRTYAAYRNTLCDPPPKIENVMKMMCCHRKVRSISFVDEVPPYIFPPRGINVFHKNFSFAAGEATQKNYGAHFFHQVWWLVHPSTTPACLPFFLSYPSRNLPLQSVTDVMLYLGAADRPRAW